MRGKFFSGMCTTQRVESMNKYVKDYLRKGVKLFECIPAIDRAMLRLRNNTAKDGFNAKYSTPVLKTALTKLEQQASLIYTHRCFVLVGHKIESCSALTHDNVMHNFGGRVYVLSKYGEPHNNWTCVYHGGENMRIECGCRKYESEGIPCCHLFYVMKCEHLTEIPPALIMKRWTKSAQTDTCTEFIGKGSESYQYSSDKGPSPDISYNYPSQMVSQCRGNYVVDLSGSDSFSTADPIGSTPNSDDGFSFDNGEPNSLGTGSTQNNCSFGTWFTCNN
ncbi:unnamed protein product [Prunus armeniaca]